MVPKRGLRPVPVPLLHNAFRYMYGGTPSTPDGPHRGNMAKTQEERKAETRARLLAAAAALFAEQGVDAVSVDAVAEAAGRTSGAVYAHFGSKQGLLLALLDSWKDSVRTVLLAEVAVTESPRGSWPRCGTTSPTRPTPSRDGGHSSSTSCGCVRPGTARWPTCSGSRDAEARRFSAHQLAGWTSAVGTRPAAEPEGLAVLVKALLTGLAMQRRLDPGAVSDDLAVRGIGALVGLGPADAIHRNRARPHLELIEQHDRRSHP